MKEFSGPRKPVNCICDLLANNAIYSIKFPKPASATQPNLESAPPLPRGPPPPTPEPPISSPTPYQSVQMVLSWTYWYCSPPPNDGASHTQPEPGGGGIKFDVSYY